MIVKNAEGDSSSLKLMIRPEGSFKVSDWWDEMDCSQEELEGLWTRVKIYFDIYLNKIQHSLLTILSKILLYVNFKYCIFYDFNIVYVQKKSIITYIVSLFFSYKSILSFHIARRYFLPNIDLSKEMYEQYTKRPTYPVLRTIKFPATFIPFCAIISNYRTCNPDKRVNEFYVPTRCKSFCKNGW